MDLPQILADCREIVQRHHQQSRADLIAAIDAQLAGMAVEAPPDPAAGGTDPDPESPPPTQAGLWHFSEDDRAMVLVVDGRRRGDISCWIDPHSPQESYWARVYAEDGSQSWFHVAEGRDQAIGAIECYLGLPALPISDMDLPGDGGVPA